MYFCYVIYLEDNLRVCAPCHTPAEQAEETAPCVTPMHSQDRGPQPGCSRKEIRKYATRGIKVKGQRGRWKPTVLSVSLVPSITNTTRTDDQGFNKWRVSSGRDSWSGFPVLWAQTWTKGDQTEMMNFPAGVGAGVQCPKSEVRKCFAANGQSINVSGFPRQEAKLRPLYGHWHTRESKFSHNSYWQHSK